MPISSTIPIAGITTGQTGIIGSGCHIYPCTLGGLSGKVQQRHPIIGDYVFIGTDAGIFGSVQVGEPHGDWSQH